MDSNHRIYEHTASFQRLAGILNQADLAYQEATELPDRDRLTFSNGFYANCSALFIDIRDSSRLPAKMQRPTLARLYRAYISELVAILNGNSIAGRSTSLATPSGASPTRRTKQTSTASSRQQHRRTR